MGPDSGDTGDRYAVYDALFYDNGSVFFHTGDDRACDTLGGIPLATYKTGVPKMEIELSGLEEE